MDTQSCEDALPMAEAGDGSARSRQPRFASALCRSLPELLFVACILPMLALRIAEEHRVFFATPGASWGASEWMIDYAAGFVRRGLGGAILRDTIRSTGIGFFPVWIAAGTLSFLGLCALMLRATSCLRGPRLWRLALLLNPMLLITACHYGTFARKDLLFVWATLINVSLCSRVVAMPNRSMGMRAALPLAVFSAAAVVLALLHEGLLLFAWFPINFAVCLYVLSRMELRRRALLLLLALLPPGVALAAVVFHHGNAPMAKTICESWRFAVPVPCGRLSAMPPEVAALGWSLARGIALATTFAPRFPLYPAIFVLAGGLLILSIRILIPAARLEHLMAALLLPFLASLPLYLLGDDWGRWLALVAMSSLPAMLSPQIRPACYFCLPPRLRRLIDSAAPFVERRLQSLRRGVERHRILFCAALLLLEIPPLPVNLLIFLNPPVMSMAVHLARHFAR